MPPYAFNRTWNSEKTEDLQTSVRESDANTNVIRFRDAYQDDSIFYLNGVGTRLSWSCAREDAAAEATARRCALFEGN